MKELSRKKKVCSNDDVAVKSHPAGPAHLPRHPFRVVFLLAAGLSISTASSWHITFLPHSACSSCAITTWLLHLLPCRI